MALATLTIVVSSFAPSTEPARADWPWAGLFDSGEPVGSSDWWRSNQDKAVFEPGKGYKIEGVDGYFDQNGRPFGRPVTVAEVAAQAPHPDVDESNEEGILPGLDPRVALGRMKNAAGFGPNDQIAQEAFTIGEQLFQAGVYSASALAYGDSAKRAINMRLKEDALFMKAESFFFNDRYIKARDAYNELADKYPSTRYLDRLVERQWDIAQYWEKYEDARPDWAMTPNGWDKTRPWFDTIGHAIKTYDNIRMNDPTGPRADDAIMATAGIYFRRGRYDDADHHFSLLRREYPRSEFQFEAHLLGLKSKLLKYQGADYDGSPLEEAQQLIVQLRRNFGGQLSAEERERLKIENARLNQELAQRDMVMAKHYDGTKHYGAAKQYYSEVERKFPDSELAQQARERIAQISGEPNEPPKRLAWFVDLFPVSAEKKTVANVPELQNGTLLARAPKNGSAEGGNVQPASATR
jgi:TolA-binding protein